MTGNPFLYESSTRRPDPLQTPFDSPMMGAFSNTSAITPYLRQNTQDRLDESLTWGEMFDSAWTGVKTGVGSYAPERFYRALRTVGTMLGSDSLQEWAGQGIEENVRERSEDPWYKPDETWMNKEWGRALYDGFANFTASLTTTAPGVLAALAFAPAAAGGVLGSMLLMKGSAFLSGAAVSNTLMGFSEFDSFVDNAHAELSRIDPGITRDTVRSDKFWQAVISGVAEGGFGMVSSVLAGKLTGIVGEGAGKQASHLVTQLIRNTYSSVFTELGEEAATAYVQDWARELAGLDYEGRWKAIQNIIKPTLVAGVLGGGSKTAFGSIQKHAEKTKVAVGAEGAGLIDTQAAADLLITREQAAKARESLSPHAFEMMQLLSTTEGLSHGESLGISTTMDALANRLAAESGEDVGTIFKTLDPNDPALRRLVQAVQNKDADLDTVAAETFEFLHNRLTPEAQQGIAGAFLGEGDALNSFRKYLRGDVNVPESAAFGFDAMKNVLSDVTNAAGNNSRLSVNTELFNALRPAEGTVAAPQAPAISRNDAALKQAIEADAGNIGRVAGTVNFDTLSGSSPATPVAAFQQWEAALAPLLEKVADSKRRRPDARNFRLAAKEMEGNPGVAEMAAYFGKAYGGDKGLIVMNKILEVAGVKVEELAARFEMDQSLENSMQLAVMAEQYQMMTDFRNGAESEAGRMLRMVGISRNDPRYADKITASLQGLGGANKLAAMATAIRNAKNAHERDLAISSASKAKTMDMFIEYVTAGMLWGPSTHVVNAFSNTTNLFKSVFEKGLAEKTNTTGEGVASGETVQYMLGMWRAAAGLKRMWSKHRAEHSGFGSAFADLKSAWNHTEYGFDKMSGSGEMHSTITGKNVEGAVNRTMDKAGLSSHHYRMSDGMSGVVDLFGRFIRLPFTALEHSDKVFKYITYVGELYARAHRESNGDIDAYNRMLRNPPADIKKAAMDFAKEMTFQQDLGAFSTLINKARTEVPATRLFIPFLKTPINILKEGMSMTPGVNALLGDFQQKLRSTDPAVRQMAEAKLMTGQLIWGTAVMLASAGFLTGPGPADPDERRKQQATGKRFNAIKVGDTYYQIDRLDPLAAVFNSAAFVTEIVDNVDSEDLGKAMWMGIGQTMRLFTNRSYIESFSDIVNILMEPERYGEEAIRRMGGMLVPASGMMRTINRSDPFLREADDLQSAIMQNIPGLSSYLPERRDFLGQPVKSADYLGTRYLSPFQVGTENKDPVYQEVNRLHGLGLSAVPMPKRHFTREGQKMEMAPKEYAQFLDRYGNKTRINDKTLLQWLHGFVASSEYKRLSDEAKADKMALGVRKYAQQARDEIFESSPRLRKIAGAKAQGWDYLLRNVTR